MGWFGLVNAFSKIEGRKKLFYEGVAFPASGACAGGSGNDGEKSACDSDRAGWRPERWAQIDPLCRLEKFNFASFHL